MRKFFGLLNLILCLELVVSPFAPSLSLLGNEAHATSCPTGFNFDSVLNRCLTKTETANVMNATAACNGDKECYKRNAQEAFQKELNAGKGAKSVKDNKFISNVANIAAVAGPVTLAVSGMASSGSTCTSASFWTMVGGSVALFVGDNLANFQHNKRLKEIKKDWEKIVSPQTADGDKDKEKEISMEAQSQSFEMLARSEDSLAKAAKMKKTFFTVATLAYAASGIIAGVEIIAENNPVTGVAAKIANLCSPKGASIDHQEGRSLYAAFTEGKKEFYLDHIFYHNLSQSNDMASFLINKKAMEENNSSPSLDYYLSVQDSFKDTTIDRDSFAIFKDVSISILRNLIPIQSAVADESNASKSYKEMESSGSNPLVTAGIGAVAGGVAGYAVKQATAKAMAAGPVKPLITPTMRAAYSGVMAGMTMIMASHAGKQAEASTKRAELLRQMRDEFKSAYGAINNCKSEDRNDPGKPECYCYTSENAKNPNRGSSKVCQDLWAGISTKSGDYTSLAKGNSKICIKNNNQADPTCSCRATNSCMKVNLSGLKGIGTGTFSMLSQAVDPINKISNGSVDAANLDAGSMANLAAKLNRAQGQLEKNKGLAAFKKNKKKMGDDIKKGLVTASSSLSSNSLLGSTGNSMMPSNPGEAARMLEKELAGSPITTVGSSEGIAAPSSAGGEDFNLEFGMTQDDLAAQESQLAEVMNQDLDYGGNDINQGSKANIFEVLSNRYQRSGMRRLFDEKGTTTADQAAKTDITQ